MEPSGSRSKSECRLFCACSYHDPFIRDTAQRLNLIAKLAFERKFEALRFMRDLRIALLAGNGEPTKRA